MADNEEIIGIPGDGPSSDQGRGPSSAITGKDSIVVGLDGLAPGQIREWNKNFSPYFNLASNKKISERARQFANQIRRNHKDATIQIKERWRVLNYLLEGNTLTEWDAPDAIHVPELYKMLETMVPRIEDAVFHFDPWFSVKGRDQMSDLTAAKIKSFLDYQLDQARINGTIPYSIRTMLIYGFAAYKTRWSYESDWRVEREVKRTRMENGKSKFDITRREVERVTFEGPKADLVDPVWFIIEPTCTDPQKARYIGDTCEMTYDEIAALGEQGVFKNHEQLFDKEKRGGEDDYGDYTRQERSSVWPYGSYGSRRPEGSPKVYEVTEIWGRFDLYGTGRTRECVITVSEDVVLRVQENPFDDKHRPYAVAKANKYPFDFYSIGPLDHCIPLSIELDTHRQIGLEANKLAMCPITFMDETVDAPDSLWGVEPGTVFKGQYNSIQQLKVGTSLREMEMAESILRRDHEEVAGAPRVFEGTSEGEATATGIERKIQEGNKRIRSYVRAFTSMTEELLRQFHALNRQYVTRDMKYRVLGKSGAKLDEYEEVGPEDFGPDVDFEFMGVSNLHTVGMEATNMQQFLGAAWPLIQANPGLIDVPAALDFLFEKLVGRIDRKVVNVPNSLDSLMSQEDEILVMLEGQRVPVNYEDDDEEHIMVLERDILDNPRFDTQSPDVQKEILEHYENHKAQMRQKRVRQSAAQNPQPRVAGGQQLGVPGQGSLPQPSPEDPSTTPPGETPGPPNSMRQPKPGRDYGFSQTDNMGGTL